MKEILQRRVFWMIIVILLLAVFVYPPFIQIIRPEGVVVERSWGWIFFPPKSHLDFLMELDYKTILAEGIIAILFTIGICLIPFKKIGLMFKWVLTNRYLKWALVIIMALIPIFWGLSKYHDFVQKQRLKEIKKEQTIEQSDEQASGKTIKEIIEEIRQRVKQ